MIFFAALALLVAAVLLPLAIPALQQRILVWRVRYRYKETVCRVVSREVGTELAARSAMHFRGGHQHRATEQVVRYVPQVTYTYFVNGREYRSSAFAPRSRAAEERAAVADVLSRWEPGREYPCWYDPGQPESAFLERR